MGRTWNGLVLGLFCLITIIPESQGRGCASGWFGSNCQYRCHCNLNSFCDKWTGKCTYGRHCSKEWFGTNCQNKCDCTENSCDLSNGQCSYGSECVKGWFGSSCQYKCHCTNDNCDTETGRCNAGSTCVKGWFGPACQYVDLTTTEFWTSTPQWLYDGSDTTCNRYPSSTSVQVTLSGQFLFTWMRLRFENEDTSLQQRISVRFSDKIGGSLIDCTNMKIVVVDKYTLDIQCDSVLVQQVDFNADRIKSLCSVYISGGRNVALKQPTEQSSTYKHGSSISINAVDGNTDGNWFDGSCTHTDPAIDRTPHWTVNFSMPKMVNRYVLYNRNDSRNCCQVRLKGFNLTSYDDNDKQVFHYHEPGTTRDKYTVKSATHTSLISSLEIKATTLHDGHTIVTLCEVEAYGDSMCANNKYGRECEGTCNCENNEQCFVSTGGCPSGCAAGYYGEKCDIHCLPKYYGISCRNLCSLNCADRLCNRITGDCNNCEAGKIGNQCNIPCALTKYGVRCSSNCSTNCVRSECNAVNGSCNDCPDGKKGDQCDTDCSPTEYGSRCVLQCSTNCADQRCNSVSGDCLKCIPGKTGRQCTRDCLPTYYGANCTERCSKLCDNQQCDRITGYCGQCPPGKKGDRCDQDCEDTKYGAGCLANCSTKCLDQLCDKVNGTCNDCPNGKIGEQCEKECENGTYGKQCSETCSLNCGGDRSCFPENGTCFFACRDGYSGDMCTEKLQSFDAVVGAIIAAVFIILLIVFGVLMWKRRKNIKHDTANTSATYANTATIAGHANNRPVSDPEAITQSKPVTPVELSTLVQHTPNIETSAVTVPETASKPAVKPKPPAKPHFAQNPNEKEATNGTKGKNEVYYNTVKDLKSSTAVTVADLAAFMASKNNDFFLEQYKSIPNNLDATTAVGMNDQNRHKNRYKNICPYDHSRVHLEINEAKNQGDYINASYIEGYKGEEKFIATQGPTKIIMDDFIRMIWEQRVDKVVMLTNLVEEGKPKCERYWPEDDAMQIDDIKVVLTTTDVFADYTIRRMQLSKKGEPVQAFTQFHFTAWPDKGVPTTPWPLVDFEQRVASYSTNRPIVVHCSAGVGRTGTFIALRNVMREAEDSGGMDFFTTVAKMRQDRVNMVQTAEQYEFIHKAAHVAIICMGTTVTASDIQQRIKVLEKTSKSGQSNMEKEFKEVCAACDDDVKDYDKNDADSGENVYSVYQNSRSVGNKIKNRLTNILPKEYYRVRLMSKGKEMGDYINAVFVPSFRKQNQQILTQLPLPLTVTDFWRLVTQYKVTLVVAFEEDLKATDSTIGDYLPPNEKQQLKLPLFSIATGPSTRGDFWEKRKITITASEERKAKRVASSVLVGEHLVTHLKCTLTGYDPAKLLNLVKQIKSLNPVGEGRTVYMCRNGADYSGLVCVLSLLLDRMDNDHRLTVPLVVGAIKAIRPQVIPTLEQYRALYEVLKYYNDTSSVYSNFG